MTELAAHGGPVSLDIPSPHYAWPIVDDTLRKAILAQTDRSLSDRDASGVLGEFEAAFAHFTGAPYAVTFATGTAAIHGMSRIAGLRPGDAILAPGYTFLATASPFAFEGIQVVFTDADEFGNVTAATLAERLTPAVRAVIVTHMWGNPCNMPEIAEFCRANGLLLFEDCSHAHFASSHGQHVGTLADMAVYSTNQKAITTGEGGVLTMKERGIYERALLFGHYNKRSQSEIDPSAEYYPFAFTGMGLKERMHPLAAAIGLDQLTRAADIEHRRRAILDRFASGLHENGVLTPLVVPASEGAHGLYVIGLRFNPENARVSRDEFVRLCHAEGATEVDVPGSTRNLSSEPLFSRRDPHAAYQVARSAPRGEDELPGFTRFEPQFLKIPIWGSPGDDAVVEGYLAALSKVSAAVAES